MVSKASDDFPEPESPVMTVRRLRGIETETFLRLCSRAPRTTRYSWAIAPKGTRSLVRGSTGSRLPQRHLAFTSLHDTITRGVERRRGAGRATAPTRRVIRVVVGELGREAVDAVL